MSIAISMTISMTIISIAGLSISGPLAIISMVSITTISVANMSIAISMTISISIAMAISMTIVAISRLSNSHTQEGKRNSNQKFHVVSWGHNHGHIHDHSSHIQAQQ